MLFTGWEVGIGRNCARGLEYRPRPMASGGTQTEGFKSFRKICLSLQPMCVDEGRVSVDVQSAIDCKPKQNITT